MQCASRVDLAVSPSVRPLVAVASVLLWLAGCAGDGQPPVPPLERSDVPESAANPEPSPDDSTHASDSGATPTGIPRIRLVEELRIGRVDGDEAYIFGRIRGVIPGPDDGVWVMDAQVPELRLYDKQGVLVRRVGRSGQGPGEFGGSALTRCAFAGPDGEVWVEDGRLWQRFSRTGELLGQISYTGVICSRRTWLPGNRLLLGETRLTESGGREAISVLYQYVEEDDALLPLDTIEAPALRDPPIIQYLNANGSPAGTRAVPFAPRDARWVHPEGGYWVVRGGGSYVIERMSFSGETLLVVQHSYTPVPIPAVIRRATIEEIQNGRLRVQGGFGEDRMPRVYPPFDDLLTGTDGTLWVRRHLEGGREGLDVFSPEGRFLGAAEVPDDFDRFEVGHLTGDQIFGVVEDELGVQYVAKLAIRR